MSVTISVLPYSKTAKKEASHLISEISSLLISICISGMERHYRFYYLPSFQTDDVWMLMFQQLWLLSCNVWEGKLTSMLDSLFSLRTIRAQECTWFELSLTAAVNSSIVVLDIRAESSLTLSVVVIPFSETLIFPLSEADLGLQETRLRVNSH